MKVAITSIIILIMVGCVSVQSDGKSEGISCKIAGDKPIEYAKACKKLADLGDADAMFNLGILLTKYGPQPLTASKEQKLAWSFMGDRTFPKLWIDKAAENGSKKAIALKCKIGSDPLAPIVLQNEGKLWCGKL